MKLTPPNVLLIEIKIESERVYKVVSYYLVPQKIKADDNPTNSFFSLMQIFPVFLLFSLAMLFKIQLFSRITNTQALQSD